MRRRDFISIADVVRQYGDRDELRSGRHSLRVKVFTKEYLGERLLSYVSDIKFEQDNGVLIIKTQSAPLRSNLLMERERMQRMINERMKSNVVRAVQIVG